MHKAGLASVEPRSALLLTVARIGSEGHTVLTVRTSEGDLVLDNLTSAIRDWSRTPYGCFARQSQSNGKRWERIGAARQVPSSTGSTDFYSVAPASGASYTSG
jgi:predicted transglutaminase-like cysteine proteinase